MNRELVQACHCGPASAHEHTLRFYRLLDQLRERFPQTEFESCASGGGRIDYEVLKRTHRFWASDNNDALERQTIQRGMSYFFPPEVITDAGLPPFQSGNIRTRCRRHSP